MIYIDCKNDYSCLTKIEHATLFSILIAKYFYAITFFFS